MKKTAPETPTLPAMLAQPLALLPRTPALFALQKALNVVFAEYLQNGEIDFLDQRSVNVRIEDAGVEFALSVDAGKMIVRPAADKPDLCIAGKTWAFLRLASRAEDSDTLFFRRELSTTGDTDLGLCIKNFLDALEPETLPLHAVFEPALRFGTRALQARSR